MANQHVDSSSDHASREVERRALASVALVVGIGYLSWRTTTLSEGWTLSISLALLLTEAWAFIELLLLTYRAWAVPSQAKLNDQGPTDLGWQGQPAEPIDVVIAAHGQHGELIERTLVGAIALVGKGEVVVVDAKQRDNVEAMVNDLAARYVVDGDVRFGPADRLEAHTSSELYLWLDAGDVTMPDALLVLRRSFDDERVAVCQSAVGLMNADSLVYLRGGRDDEALTREVTGPSGSRFGAAPWRGPASLIRRSAIAEIGGFPQRTPLAVGRAHVRLHRAGWKTTYQAPSVVRAATVDTMAGYLEGRRVRARLALGLYLSPDSPLRGQGLRWRHRLVHLGDASTFAAGTRRFLQLAILIVVLFTGQVPFEGPTTTLAVAWLANVGLGAASRRVLGRGSMAVGDWVRHGWRTTEADLRALFDLARRSGALTHHDPKANTGLAALGQLRLLTGAVVVLDLALLARAVTLFSPRVLPPMATADRMIVLGIALLQMVLMVDVLQLVVLRRQRRRHHRLHANLRILVDGVEATTVDISQDGIGLLTPSAPEVGETVRFKLLLPGLDGSARAVNGSAIVRAVASDPAGLSRVGLEFEALDNETRLVVVAYCVLVHARAQDLEQQGEHAPGLLRVERRSSHSRGLEGLTGLAAMAGLAVFFAGPSAGVASADRIWPTTVCIVDPDLQPVEAATISALGPDGWRDIGETAATGCIAVEGQDDRYAAQFVGNRNEADALADVNGMLTIGLRDRFVTVFDRAGDLVAVDVRYRIDDATTDWLEAEVEGLVAVIPARTPATDVELSLRGVRHVQTFDGSDVTLRLSSLVSGPGVEIADVNLGAGWEPFIEAMEVLPGPIAIRFADGRVMKVDVPAGHEFFAASGVSYELPPLPTTAPPTTIVPPVTEQPTTVTPPITEQPTTEQPPTTTLDEPTTTLPATTQPSTTSVDELTTTLPARTQPTVTESTATTTTAPPTSSVPSTSAPTTTAGATS